MTAATAPTSRPGTRSLAETNAVPSPAGPVDPDTAIRMPPGRHQSRLLQSIRFVMRPMSTSLSARRELGDVWQVRLLSREQPFVVTSHPEHVEALFKAKP